MVHIEVINFDKTYIISLSINLSNYSNEKNYIKGIINFSFEMRTLIENTSKRVGKNHKFRKNKIKILFVNLFVIFY